MVFNKLTVDKVKWLQEQAFQTKKDHSDSDAVQDEVVSNELTSDKAKWLQEEAFKNDHVEHIPRKQQDNNDQEEEEEESAANEKEENEHPDSEMTMKKKKQQGWKCQGGNESIQTESKTILFQLEA